MQDILIVDNFDSFTYNLAHYFEGLGCHVDVVRKNDLDIDITKYDRIVISPGPGLPDDSQVHDLITRTDNKTPILGVCLGMQGIAQYLKGRLVNKSSVKHGVEDIITVDTSSPLFENCDSIMTVGLYHSWEVTDEGDYCIDAVSNSDGAIMAISNIEERMYGVQFHPESILTQEGRQVLDNFLKNG